MKKNLKFLKMINLRSLGSDFPVLGNKLPMPVRDVDLQKISPKSFKGEMITFDQHPLEFYKFLTHLFNFK